MKQDTPHMVLTLQLTVGPPILGDVTRIQRYIADQLIQVANDILKGGRTGETRRNSKQVCTWTVTVGPVTPRIGVSNGVQGQEPLT